MIIKKNCQQGFSLIEVLVTTVVFATGLLAIAGLQLSGIKNAHNALMETQARYIATSLLNKIRDNPDGLSTYVTAAISCSTTPSPNCISTTASTTACSAVNLAKSEKYQAICGNRVTVGAITTSNGGVISELPNGSLTIQCLKSGVFGTDCTSTTDLRISISWQERKEEKSGGMQANSIQITGSI
jgi:type IV pilus modification protein PilV